MTTQNNQQTSEWAIYFFPRLVGVVLFDAYMGWLIVQLIGDGAYPLAAILTSIAVFVSAAMLIERMKAYRWMSIGIGLAMLFVLYPIIYTLYLSTTNTGLGHILTEQQAIERLEREQYVPEDGLRFSWTAFRADDGRIALWLQGQNDDLRFVTEGTSLRNPVAGDAGIGEFDSSGIPLTIEGYTRLETRDVVILLNDLGKVDFGDPEQPIRVMGLGAAATTRPRYQYDADAGTITDLQTGTTYTGQRGTFTSAEGAELVPGFFVDIGTDNFERFFNSAALRGPLLQILTWNFVYAIFSVLTSFALGLFIAILFDKLPGRKIIRTLLIVPYPIPALVSILIWRNLLNPDFGALVQLQKAILGTAPNWLTDPNATRLAIIIVNMWLSYPYFYIISSGALQALPSDILDAASVDGASVWQKFRSITLPLLLRIVSPLLVASFAFNFNNFNLIYIFNEGNPPIANTPIPAGNTDILISFVYKLAFNSAQADYGLAAAISIVLFVFVAIITWIQFRMTGIFEDKEA
ncbi:MAG: ABC transporter permease subunit [Anaerolineae bacterium]|nr:ABC transporter permease subunit [Anaerolineae bacterium]